LANSSGESPVIAIALRFLAGRFHSTPWNRHVNEGAVEWPPAPWRLVRALVSTWKVCLPERLDSAQAAGLLAKLTGSPAFSLPPATLGHTRHFMPWFKKGPEDRTMVFDAFVAVSPTDEVVLVWPGELTSVEAEILADLLGAMGYLGRAESWCEARLLPAAEADRVTINCRVLGEEAVGQCTEIVPVLLPDPQTAFDGTHVPRAKGTKKAPGATLCDPAWNLCLDTAQLAKEGWSDPPGSRWVRYARSPDCFMPPARLSIPPSGFTPTLARYALDGPVLPRITETLRVAEAVRRVLMGCHRTALERHHQLPYRSSSPGQFKSPRFSGKDAAGIPLKGHQHAFFLPIDEDGDGFIDHVLVQANAGFDTAETEAIRRARRIVPSEGVEIGLVLLALEESPQPATARIFRSATPFVAQRHLKTRGAKRDPAGWRTEGAPIAFLAACLREEIARRGLPNPIAVHPLLDEQGSFRSRPLTGRQGLRAIQFARARCNRGKDDGARRSSGFFEVVFEDSVPGPLALGHNCHFGLGLFLAQPG
jgi:CRISPR-associated protein Csb2